MDIESVTEEEENVPIKLTKLSKLAVDVRADIDKRLTAPEKQKLSKATETLNITVADFLSNLTQSSKLRVKQNIFCVI